ncbi:MAG: hypothetical protein GX262_13495 [Clostridia bacterium]|nr:hypothetical protein [Clostridia bacterium]
MKNTLADLNNHLFMQLERLNDEEIQGEKLQEEISRAKAISNIATQIINNGSLVLRSQEFMQEYGLIEGSKGEKRIRKIPPMLRGELMGG